MPNYTHRTTKQHLRSVSPRSLPEPEANYIKDSAEANALFAARVSTRYWLIVGDFISEMSRPEKDTVDAEALEIRRDDRIEDDIDNLESTLRQLVVVLVSELNILRALHGLPDLTLAKVETQLRNGYGS